MQNKTQTRADMVEQIAKHIADCDFESIDEVADRIYLEVSNNCFLNVNQIDWHQRLIEDPQNA